MEPNPYEAPNEQGYDQPARSHNAGYWIGMSIVVIVGLAIVWATIGAMIL